MNKIILGLIITGGAATTIYAVYKFDKNMKAYLKKAEERRKFKEAQEKERLDKLNNVKSNFEKKYTDKAISKVTLNNKNITKTEDKAYLYSKLNVYKGKVLGFNNPDNLERLYYLISEFHDLYNYLSEAESDGIDARLWCLHQIDNKLEAATKKWEAEQAEKLAHRREIEKIEAKNKAELDLYKAKLDVEKAKMETICEAVKTGTKTVQTTLNNKINISED